MVTYGPWQEGATYPASVNYFTRAYAMVANVYDVPHGGNYEAVTNDLLDSVNVTTSRDLFSGERFAGFMSGNWTGFVSNAVHRDNAAWFSPPSFSEWSYRSALPPPPPGATVELGTERPTALTANFAGTFSRFLGGQGGTTSALMRIQLVAQPAASPSDIDGLRDVVFDEVFDGPPSDHLVAFDASGVMTPEGFFSLSFVTSKEGNYWSYSDPDSINGVLAHEAIFYQSPTVNYLMRGPRWRYVYADDQPALLPPLRQFPRDDGLATSTAARPWASSQQGSARRHGYY